ncbi:MAG TPA: hypothetical protein VG734_13335 [Lacunisphaera sp.]|nr:hypothetical protein [Lacunisphaera sp.]
MRRDLRPVSEFAWRTDHGGDGELDAGHVLQQFLHLLALPLQLFGVDQVLVLAAAAGAEERALGVDAVRRGRQHLQQVGLGEILVVAIDPRADLLAGQREGDHDDPPAVAPVRGAMARPARLIIFPVLGPPSSIFCPRFPGLWQRHPPQAYAEICEGGDFQLDLGAVREGTVVELLFAHKTHETTRYQAGEEKSRSGGTRIARIGTNRSTGLMCDHSWNSCHSRLGLKLGLASFVFFVCFVGSAPGRKDHQPPESSREAAGEAA